ncbi:MAG: YHS domain-containing protein [Chloroflexi bacterium]|nr:YHS domain-containing protein [Chloroflexota bacterium]
MAIVKDPVSGEDVDTDKLPTRWTHEGKIYYFGTLKNRNKFLANPESFLTEATK